MLEFEIEFKRVIKTEHTCSHNDEVDASASGHRHLRRQLHISNNFKEYFIFLNLKSIILKDSQEFPITFKVTLFLNRLHILLNIILLSYFIPLKKYIGIVLLFFEVKALIL